MTVQDMKSFVEKAFSDKDLGAALQETVSSSQGTGVPGALVALGAKNGFTFTEKEAVQARDMIRTTSSNDGELTDEQLEAVAGGGWGSDANSWLSGAWNTSRNAVATQANEVTDFFSGW